MQSFNYYPHGFRIPNRQHCDETAAGDSEVIELFNRMCTIGTFDSTDPTLVKEVLACAVRLIPNPVTFVLMQESNHYVDDSKWAYLYDILNFITTGKKGISSEGILRMLVVDNLRNTFHTAKIDVKRSLSVSGFCKMVNSSELEVNLTSDKPTLELWFSRVESIEEIVCTLYVLFGNKT
jgi:hypothetical protein